MGAYQAGHSIATDSANLTLIVICDPIRKNIFTPGWKGLCPNTLTVLICLITTTLIFHVSSLWDEIFNLSLCEEFLVIQFHGINFRDIFMGVNFWGTNSRGLFQKAFPLYSNIWVRTHGKIYYKPCMCTHSYIVPTVFVVLF